MLKFINDEQINIIDFQEAHINITDNKMITN